MVITFEELRNIKDRLPHGSLQKIADDLHVDVQSVRNYFGGPDVPASKPSGVHIEQGTHGGYVRLDDMRIFEAALKMLG